MYLVNLKKKRGGRLWQVMNDTSNMAEYEISSSKLNFLFFVKTARKFIIKEISLTVVTKDI